MRLTLSEGVSSPEAIVKSLGRIWNRLTLSNEASSRFALSTSCSISSRTRGWAASSSRPAESRSFFERTLRIDEEALGPDHPDVAEDLVEYAKLLRKMGDDASAVRMEARAKAIREKQ